MNKNTLLIAEYEQQLRSNPQDIDIRWKLVQARYEIVTVGNRLLLGRVDMPRIYTDRDARLVLEGVQGEEKEKFLEQIRMLGASQEAVEKVKNTDSVCEVYLAFDESSKEDASIAKDIYYGLSEKGISVYYEPEKALVGDLDAHRLFALQHAKVLILVGTSAESMQKEATAGAWMRYLNRMERDSHIHIVPAYKNMNPKDFPGGLAKIQGIDVGRIGAIQAFLIPRVQELIGGQDQVLIVKKSDGKQVNISNVLSRIEFLLEDGEFALAQERLYKFSEDYGTDYEQFHYLNLLQQVGARNQKELALAVNEELLASSDYQYLIGKGSPQMKEEMLGLMEKKAKYQKEQKEETYIEEIRKAHVDGNYSKVLMLVNEVKAIEGFSRWADINAYYQAAKTRVKKQNLREEFLKLVGDGKNFYINQLKEKEPDKYQMLIAPDTVPKPDRKIGLLALTGIICFICLFLCRVYPEAEGLKWVIVGFFVCLFYSIVTRISDEGLVLAIVKGALWMLIPVIVLVLLVNIMDQFVPRIIEIIAFVFGLLTGFPVKLSEYGGLYGGYSFDVFRIAFVFGMPNLVFLIRGIKAFTIYRAQRIKRQRADKEYRQLFSSGFLKEFQKQEYAKLEEHYKEAVGSDWIEPVEIAKKGRKRR